MTGKTTNLSQSLEEYLETVFILSQKKKPVRVKDMVGQLKVRSASVIGALKKLSQNGYVEHERYGYIELTEKGLSRAKAIYKKHLVLYEFLTEVLKVENSVAEKDACVLEHHISNETVEKLSRFVSQIKQLKIDGDTLFSTKSENAEWRNR